MAWHGMLLLCLQGVLKAINVNKLTRCGVTFKFWVREVLHCSTHHRYSVQQHQWVRSGLVRNLAEQLGDHSHDAQCSGIFWYGM